MSITGNCNFKNVCSSQYQKYLLMKNLTNGDINLRNIDPEWKVANNYRFARVPGGDNYDQLKKDSSLTTTSYHIENIRTGQFTEISQNYISTSAKDKDNDEEIYTTDSFQAEMRMLISGFQGKLSRAINFFQGLYAGMALLFTIALTLSTTVQQSLVRVQDQSIRVLSMLSAFGALYALISIKYKYDLIKTRGTANDIDQHYKCFVLCILEFIFYQMSYIVFNVSHQYAVRYSTLTDDAESYSTLRLITIVYTIFVILGWIFSNANTAKHEIL